MLLWPADNVLKVVTTKPRNRLGRHSIPKQLFFLAITALSLVADCFVFVLVVDEDEAEAGSLVE